MDVNPKKVGPSLARWSIQALEDERQSVIIQIDSTADPQEATNQLEKMGAVVESAGQRVLTCIVSAGMLAPISHLPWVVSINEPRQLNPTFNKLRLFSCAFFLLPYFKEINGYI